MLFLNSIFTASALQFITSKVFVLT